MKKNYLPSGLWLARLALLGLLLAIAAGTPGKATAASDVRIANFPSVQQWYSLSCEYAAAAAVTLYWGDLVSQRDFLREVPQSPNPHLGFRGNINGPIGGLTDYGIYAEPLVPVLEAHGYDATVFYGDASRLKAYVRSGYPVVAWLTTGQQARRPITAAYQGERFTLVAGEHAVVIYGFTDYGVRMMDVGDGNYYLTSWDSFLRRWGYFDEMALVITPTGARSLHSPSR
jgi:uncharacterized protein YvpB